MTVKNSDRPTLTQIALRFLLGAVVGFIPPLILLSYTWQSGSELTAIQILISVSFAGLCATLSAIWGQKFVDRLLELMNFMPQI